MNSNEQLCLHPDYEQRLDPTHFDDRLMRDDWQDAVYDFALSRAQSIGARRIVDLGCGSGYKLMKYFSGYETVGYELEPALSYLRETYPDRAWCDAGTLESQRMIGDLLICSDVIEHVLDATAFLENLKRGPLHWFVFSTPALEVLADRGWSPRLGPPNNTSHVREWTTREFYDFISMHIRVVEQYVINCKQGTQLVFAKLK